MDPLHRLLQHALPKAALTRLAGRVAAAEHPRLTPALIRWFARRYGVNMAEAANPDLSSYPSFNAFFTRPLAPGARPLANAPFICPVDGAVSQLGPIDGHQLIQAKGQRYTTAELLADPTLAEPFAGGHFANLYLSPRDYHRIHMPAAGTLRTMIHVPGSLFSVNPATARTIPGLFTRNERVVCLFDTTHGPFALVLVGATVVGGMELVWHGVVNAKRTGKPTSWAYPPGAVTLAQGQEMGRFLLGSTVIMLWPPNTIRLNPTWAPERAVRLGEMMGERAG